MLSNKKIAEYDAIGIEKVMKRIANCRGLIERGECIHIEVTLTALADMEEYLLKKEQSLTF